MDASSQAKEKKADLDMQRRQTPWERTEIKTGVSVSFTVEHSPDSQSHRECDKPTDRDKPTGLRERSRQKDIPAFLGRPSEAGLRGGGAGKKSEETTSKVAACVGLVVMDLILF